MLGLALLLLGASAIGISSTGAGLSISLLDIKTKLRRGENQRRALAGTGKLRVGRTRPTSMLISIHIDTKSCNNDIDIDWLEVAVLELASLRQ